MRINESQLYKDVGRRVRDRRNELGITQRQLGDEIGLLRTSVVNIEGGNQKAPLHVLYAIANALRIEARDLLPALDSLERPDLVRVQIGDHTREVPAKAAELLSRLLDQ